MKYMVAGIKQIANIPLGQLNGAGAMFMSVCCCLLA